MHLLFGMLGVVAFAGLFAPRVYAQIVAVAYGPLVVLGSFPATNTLFGLVPTYGNDAGCTWCWVSWLPISAS